MVDEHVIQKLIRDYANQPTLKKDEIEFLTELYQRNEREYTTPRNIILSPNFNIPYKRAWYILDKWSKNGIYDYGVSSDLGWLTPEGKIFAKWLSKQEIKE